MTLICVKVGLPGTSARGRQGEAENGAASSIRLRPDPAAVGLDDGSADRKTDAHARGLRGHERLKQPRLYFWCETAAGIGDADHHDSVPDAGCHRQFTDGTGLHRLDRIAD